MHAACLPPGLPARAGGLARLRQYSGDMVGAVVKNSSAAPRSTCHAAPSEGALPQSLVIANTPQVSPVLPELLDQVLRRYASRTPGLARVVSGVMQHNWPNGCPTSLAHDHLAFRTFGVPGLGLGPVVAALQGLGYSLSPDVLDFPAKKLTARWLSPPTPEGNGNGSIAGQQQQQQHAGGGSGVSASPLPRVFVSELRVHELSPRAQAIIAHYTGAAASSGAVSSDTSAGPALRALAAISSGSRLWGTPSLEHYRELLKDSEYAAWVLAHGYSLNHTALALYRAGSGTAAGGDASSPVVASPWEISAFAATMQAEGIAMNGEGGVVKVSPDGLLLQCASVADKVAYRFAGGEEEMVAGAYVEYVERRPLPQYAHIPAHELQEWQRRDGFEVGNADRIFHSTTLAAGSQPS